MILLNKPLSVNSSHQSAFRGLLISYSQQRLQERQLSLLDRLKWRKGKKDGEEEEGLPIKVSETSEGDMMPVDPLGIKKTLTEEQIMAIRDKSRLPADVREEMRGEGMTPFEYAWQYEKPRARKAYALFGKASGLKPGIAWPRREELYYKMGYEKVFFPTLDQLLQTMSERKAAKEKKLQDREKEVLENLKKLPKWKEEFFKEYLAKEKEIAEEKRTRERLVEEVREYLGYEVDIKDPRFQAALLRKEQEELKGRKTVSRTQARKAAMLEELAKIAEAEMAKAQAQAEAKKTASESKADASSENQVPQPESSEQNQNNQSSNGPDSSSKSDPESK